MDNKLRKQLETVVDSLIKEDNDQAIFAFHEYLRTKTQDILAEADESDDSDESEEEKTVKTKKAKMPSEGACGGKR